MFLVVAEIILKSDLQLKNKKENTIIKFFIALVFVANLHFLSITLKYKIKTWHNNWKYLLKNKY